MSLADFDCNNGIFGCIGGFPKGADREDLSSESPEGFTISDFSSKFRFWSCFVSFISEEFFILVSSSSSESLLVSLLSVELLSLSSSFKVVCRTVNIFANSVVTSFFPLVACKCLNISDAVAAPAAVALNFSCMVFAS